MTSLPLAYKPIIDSMHVYLNGSEVERGLWTYNSVTNKVDSAAAMGEVSGDKFECRYAHQGVAVSVLAPVYWYDAVEALTSSWPAHDSRGNTLAAVSGSGTLVPNALNGNPGVSTPGTSMRYQGSQPSHAFSNGITAIIVALQGPSDSSLVNLFDNSTFGSTQYQGEQNGGTTIHVIYTDEIGDTSNTSFPHTRVTGDPVMIEYGVNAAGGAFMRVNGTNLSGTVGFPSGPTTQPVDFMQIGNLSTFTWCEVMVYDANDTAGISDARSFLSTKYGIPA